MPAAKRKTPKPPAEAPKTPDSDIRAQVLAQLATAKVDPHAALARIRQIVEG